MIAERLREWASARGYRVEWGPAAAIESVRRDFEPRVESGEIDAGLARDQFDSFSFDLPALVRGRWTVVLVVMPRPGHRVVFTAGGRRIDAVIPPTYVRYRPTFAEIRDDVLANALAGARVELLDIPLKPLAARLGLARYGRNNVTYVDGVGSYCQLAGYLTDAALPIDPDWRASEPRLLDECEDCAICEAVCPTSAIRDDRVLLHAERCLTFANEKPAPLPDWVTPGAHNALIGCLMCQRHCPANPELPLEDTGLLFSEEETRALITGHESSPSALAASIRSKLDRLGLTDDSVIGRNLRVLCGQSRQP